jgi:DNA-binding transcriptional MerR regulator
MEKQLTKNDKINKLLDLGYNLDDVTKYLTVCDEDLNKTLELLLTDNNIQRDINVNPDILNKSLLKESIMKVDKTNMILSKLNKYSQSQDEIKNALRESRGNYSYAKKILKNKNQVETESDNE